MQDNKQPSFKQPSFNNGSSHDSVPDSLHGLVGASHALQTRIVEPYLTVTEAARVLDITTGAVYIAMKQGRLRWRLEGGHKVISVQDVKSYPPSIQAKSKRPRFRF